MITLNSQSEEDTQLIGRLIGQTVSAGDIILLSGDLGAGKTAIAKGIALGAGVNCIVTSPTYALMNQYEGRLPVYHFDIYRLNDPEELYDLDYEEYFYGYGLTIVEWPERMQELLPINHYKVAIIKTENLDHRKILIESKGKDLELLKEVLKVYEGACC